MMTKKALVAGLLFSLLSLPVLRQSSFAIESGTRDISQNSQQTIESEDSLDRVFYTNTTSRARTLGHLKTSWQPTPGSELDEFGFFNNNLSLGLGSRFEFGFIPFGYILNATVITGLSEKKFYQGNLKYNFWKSKLMNFSSTYGFEYSSFLADFSTLNDGKI